MGLPATNQMRIQMNFFPRSYVVVVGCNPEMAEYGNPNGEIYGEEWFVVAENDRGDRWESPPVETEGAAGLLATRLAARFANLGRLPVDFSHWSVGRPCYGSAAYAEYGAQDDIEWERQAA